MEQKHYETIIKLLTEKIEEQKITICIKDYEIEDLKRKLAEAEGMETTEVAQ